MGEGSPVAVGLAGADDGGAAAVVVGAAAVVVGAAEGLAVALEVGPVVALGAAELVVGAGAGGPKHPVSIIAAPTPRTLNTESPDLAMMPPRTRCPRSRDPLSRYARGLVQNRD